MKEYTNQNPEQRARDRIDDMLRQCGWCVQDNKKIDFSKGMGVAVREYQTDIGPADYVLFIDRIPIGVIEAKRAKEGHRLTYHEGQAEFYAKSKLKYFENQPLPFVYESTGEVTRFTDTRDPKPRSRPLFTFQRPETLKAWFRQEKSLRARLFNLPELPHETLRRCQINAINNLEKDAFKANRPKALIQMATGAGKTYTAVTFIYRLLKYADASRILFMVDTKNLGEQAEQAFMAYVPVDDNRKFSELYNVQRLKSRFVATDSQVCISTIQRLYSLLKDEDLNETAEEEYPNEPNELKEPIPVGYNSQIPMEFFDFIVIDECHRSIYNVWQQVLDYFDAFQIGLTATPDNRTFAYFDENVVSEYTHEEAIADGVNVGFDVYTIETRITKNGARLEAAAFVERREKLSRKKRWEQLDEDLEYSKTKLDKDVVNLSQIRNIIRTFKEKLPVIFPRREEVPKTLIFAKTDSHADDIIQMVRKEFGEGNAFCKKVTYKADEDPKSLMSQFRNNYYPRIAVTVDMIATGTDVKPLECLLFMRDVKSRNYFEQMKGRGTRTLQYDDLKKVTPSVVTSKTHFIIVDAIGVTKSLKTDSRPLERKRSVPLKDLLNAVLMGTGWNEDVFLSLGGRLSRLDKQISDKERQKVVDQTGGKALREIIHGLFNACNPDKIEEAVKNSAGLDNNGQPTQEQLDSAQKDLMETAAAPFTGALNECIETLRRVHEQTIDDINIDKVEFAGWDMDGKTRAEELVKAFKDFLKMHQDEIAALRIFYHQPYNRRALTFQMVREVLDILKSEKPQLAPVNVWQAYEQLEKVNGKSPKNELMALISLLRKVTGIDETLTPYDATVGRNFKNWVFEKQAGAAIKFNEEQMAWLRMIRDHIAASVHFERADLDFAPFDAKGGVGKMHELFGEEMDGMIDDMNESLVA